MNDLNQNICEHFHQVEAALYESLNADRNNTYHTALFLDKRNCKAHLSECISASYVQSIYENYIYPVYVYLEWTNNYLTIDYLTIEKFCNDHCFLEKKALKLIEEGKQILNRKYEIMNN